MIPDAMGRMIESGNYETVGSAFFGCKSGRYGNLFAGIGGPELYFNGFFQTEYIQGVYDCGGCAPPLFLSF
jgi:hypothetical protein